MRGWEHGKEARLPPGYRLDTSDTAIWVLRRPDGVGVAYFSAWGATREGVERVARDDHRRRSRKPERVRRGVASFLERP
jgi:hypothetical protein